MSDVDGDGDFTTQPTGAMRTNLNGGRYLLFGMLGVGGMASVYRCWDTELLVWRAAKVLLAELRTRNVVRERFKSEARAMAAIDHPNVARVFDVGEDHGVPFIVLEMLDGGSLEHWLAEHGAMEPALAIHTLLEVCDGVQAAHAAGLIHRDIKPDNVMVDRNGRCKVTDFGIAGGVHSSHTKTGVAMGTLDYMSPEQRQDAKNVTVAADIYALGCMLFALVMDATPANLFVAANEPSRLDGVPDALRSLIVKATAYRPEDRYRNCAELRAALRELATEFDVGEVNPRSLVSDLGPPPDPTTHSSLVPNLSDPTAFRVNSATTIADADADLPPNAEPATTTLDSSPPQAVPPLDVAAPTESRAGATPLLILAAVVVLLVGFGTLGVGLTALWATQTSASPPPEVVLVVPEPIEVPLPTPEPDPAPIAPVEAVEPEPAPPAPAPAQPTPVKPSKPASPKPAPTPAPVPEFVAVDAVRVPSAMVVVQNGTGLVVTCGDTTARGTASARLRDFPAGACSVEVQWLGTPYQTRVQIDSRREVHCEVANGKLGCR